MKNVALSLIMTTLSTLAAVLIRPMLTKLLANHYVSEDGWLLLVRAMQVVLLPVISSLILKITLPRLARNIERGMLPLAVVSIVMIAASVVDSQ